MKSSDKKKSIAVLYDGRSLKKWQIQALESIESEYNIFHLVVKNERGGRKKIIANAAYYLLNILSIRRASGSPCAWPRLPVNEARLFSFEPEYDGAWARLPDEVLRWMEERGISAVLKFGLSLLRIPESSPPILSYHHGDPRSYRGRPAGFYELRDDAPFVGQIVQRLTNRLDAGPVLAFAETRVHSHSYRATLAEAYKISPFLLRPALHRLFAGETLDMVPSGKNHRLPSNGTVIAFAATRVKRLLSRLAYGALQEKKWHVSVVDKADVDALIAGHTDEIEDVAKTSAIDIPKKYSFLADPFFLGEDTILAEGLIDDRARGASFVSAVMSARHSQRIGKRTFPIPEAWLRTMSGILFLKWRKLE